MNEQKFCGLGQPRKYFNNKNFPNYSTYVCVQVNGTTIIEGVMKIYWGLNNAITVAGGDHIYVGRSTGGFTKQEDLPDQWRKEVLALQDKRGSRMVDSVSPKLNMY